jgi:hypothetical protein
MPSKLFSLKLAYSIKLQFPMAKGMVPVKLLLEIPKEVNAVQWPILYCNVPVKSLLPTPKEDNVVHRPMLSGKVPIKHYQTHQKMPKQSIGQSHLVVFQSIHYGVH